MAQDQLEPTPYASGMAWGEGPRWHDGALWLSDTQGSKLWTDASGRWTSTNLASPSNGLWFLPDGRLVGSMMAEKRIGVWNGAEWETYADLSSLKPGPLGDMIGDDNGNLYVDDVAYSSHSGEAPRAGRLLFVGANGERRVAAEGVTFPNGLAFIDGGRTLVVAETMARRLTAFSVDSPGRLSNSRLYFDVEKELGEAAMPDGIWGTSEGIWICTLNGRCLALVRDGKIVRKIDTGDHCPIACCRDGGSRLLVTMANTGGLSVFEAVAAKAVSAEVVTYTLGD